MRNTAVYGVKTSIVNWTGFGKGNDPQSKRWRGFNSVEIGPLLCPADLDWSDPRYVSS